MTFETQTASSGIREEKGKAKKPRSARRWARELALQSLYEWRIGGADAAALEAHFTDLEGHRQADHALFLALVRGVLAEHEALAALLAEHLDRPFAELSPIEAILLLSAVWELAHSPDVPYRVVINEAIELAKVYGGTDGHRYVNGVLDKLAGKLRAQETGH
ncbi:MAG: transcription antitermination factor NusB [Zoogloeaceae bacterium]|jgi:N utilization substance protein B|nr:transcription antitermination factor NusB [Zoogloeaceae bacterium]